MSRRRRDHALPRSERRPNTTLRVVTVLVCLGLATTGLGLRAFDLQVLRNDFLSQQGAARFLRTVPVPVSRGSIFDRNGVPLAVSTPVASLWVNPGQLLREPEPGEPGEDGKAAEDDKCKGRDCVPKLAAALGVDADALMADLEQHADRQFLFLRRRMRPAAAQKVLDLGIPGVHKRREYKRYYPSGAVMAHVIGLTNIDDQGLSGLELAYNGWLSGKEGRKKVIRDLLGHEVEAVAMVREAEPGKNLYLSIDQRLQYLAWRDLKDAVTTHAARAGSIVVIDVRNGEVLAMVNMPSFNPNAVGRSKPAQRRNRAVTDLIEPGSVMKPFTIATALESGKWLPHTPVDTNPGWLYLSGYTIHDVHNHGLLDLTSVLTKSSNVGAAKISMSLDSRHMYGMLSRFGFGQRSGSGFPGEAAGVLPSPHKWTELRKATIAYGYGISSTALQLARAYAALANDGVIHVPTFVRGQSGKGKAVLDPVVADEIMRMLETVVSPDGTALRAAIANYSVAGKTGTSHIAAGGGYSDRYVSTFVGVAPASDPRLVAVVVIDDPTVGSYYGGVVAAPLFSQVMADALRLLDVPPDNVQRWYVGGPKAAQPIAVGSEAPDYQPGQAGYEEGTSP